MKKVNSRQKELIRKIKDFRLLDDDFMSKVFEDNNECTELLLHIILHNKELQVKETHVQYGIKNLSGRSIRLDIYAVDKSGKKYNIEVQRADKGATAQRARYNSSLIDANTLLPGDDFSDLPDTYIIFITEKDVIGEHKPIYHVDRVIRETGKNFGDGTHILFVNGEHRDDTPLGRLMHDFSCKNPNDMYYKVLADKTRYYKEDEKGVQTMCKLMEDLIDDEKKEIALKMLKDGKLNEKEIAKYFNLSKEQIEELLKAHTI